MGRRGPKPRPTALKLLTGNGSRPINLFEPRPPSTPPTCPDWLDAESRLKWDEVIQTLSSMGVLSVVDGDAIAGYCQAWVRWVRAERFIQEHGEVYQVKDDKGRVTVVRPFPQVSIARHLLDRLTKLQQQFGLTPSSRSSMQVASRIDCGDELDQFLKGKKPKAG